jgi:hypothetical protein
MTATSSRAAGENMHSNTPAFLIHITTTHMRGGIRGVWAMNVCFVCIFANETKGRQTLACTDTKACMQTHIGLETS